MLLIRPDQIAALSVDGMEQRIRAFLRQQFPARTARIESAALSSLIRRAMAPGSGMTTEQEIARYVMLGVITRPDFESFPWAQPVLRDPRRTGEARLGRLFALARRHGFTARAAQKG
jgi:hypothetical protein